MNQIQELLYKLRSKVGPLIRRFEQSEFFEKLMIRYESMTAGDQKRLILISRLAVILVLLFLFSYPFINVISSRTKLNTLENIKSDVKTLQEQKNSAKRFVQAPNGWIRLDTQSASAFQNSLSSYLSGIGVTEDQLTLRSQGQGFEINITDLNVRQMANLNFQIEALFPAVQFTRYDLSVHPENIEVLTFSGAVSFKAEEAKKIAQNISGFRSRPSSPSVQPRRSLPPAPKRAAPPPPPSRRKKFSAPPPSSRRVTAPPPVSRREERPSDISVDEDPTAPGQLPAPDEIMDPEEFSDEEEDYIPPPPPLFDE